jgi:hypothetical protein
MGRGRGRTKAGVGGQGWGWGTRLGLVGISRAASASPRRVSAMMSRMRLSGSPKTCAVCSSATTSTKQCHTLLRNSRRGLSTSIAVSSIRAPPPQPLQLPPSPLPLPLPLPLPPLPSSACIARP